MAGRADEQKAALGCRRLRQGGESHVQVATTTSRRRATSARWNGAAVMACCEVRIETGRTYQIRVHAQHPGHQAAGDDKSNT